MTVGSRKIWLVLALAALVAISFSATVVAAKRSREERTKFVTRGLDYLHSRQRDDGGFATPSNTGWAVLGAVGSGERMGSSGWTKKGRNPFDYFQGINHETAATSETSDNAPIYYARTIMAYVAMGRRDRVFIAGKPHIDLLAKLYSYQDTGEDSPTRGSFSPSSSTRNFDAVHTTAWAILGMHNFGVSAEERFGLAETWLAARQEDGGGFPAEVGKRADCLDTALAVQALSVGADGLDWDVDAARQFLKSSQNADGGFPYFKGGRTNAEATAAVIQAIRALGEKPDDAFWRVGINTPTYALGVLQQKDGSYKLTSQDNRRPVATTSWALLAMRGKSFASFPKNIGPAEKPFAFRPLFRTISPKNAAKFTSTHVVLIRATYTDLSPKGTGIKPSACRLYVDDVNRSRPADIGKYGLRLLLKDVPNGKHTYRIELQDLAGNTKVVQRTFTVAVPTPTPTYTPTTRPTYNPGPVYPTTYPTRTSRPYPTQTVTPEPTATDTYSPYPYPSPSSSETPMVTGSAIPSPSGSPSPGDTDGGGGSAAGFVGGTLLAMLPIGAAISYLLLHRREDLLATASQGNVLAGGGSSWERFKHTLARSKDLTRPSSRE